MCSASEVRTVYTTLGQCFRRRAKKNRNKPQGIELGACKHMMAFLINRAGIKYNLTDLLYFWSGLMIGVCAAVLIFYPRHSAPPLVLRTDHLAGSGVGAGGAGGGSISGQNGDDPGSFRLAPDSDIYSDADHDEILEQDLAQRVNLLVWVKTSPQTLNDRAKSIKDTWGQRVDKLLFISSVPNSTFPAIGLKVKEGHGYDTAMTFEGFRYVFENHLNDADWFMQVDDDTFLIVENLLYFLSEEEAQEPVYYGFLPNHPTPIGPLSCVAGGYLLSREALERFGKDESVCRRKEAATQDQHAEDFDRCLAALGVKLSSTEDALGRSRLHCLEPETYLQGAKSALVRHADFDPVLVEKRMQKMSDYSITFHGLTASKMAWMYYYVYQLAPYGRSFRPQHLNTL